MIQVGPDGVPPGVLRIGITGHRPNKLPPDVATVVRATLHDLLARLEAAHRRAAPAGSCLPEQASCLLVSGLAEGADRLAVEAAPVGWSLAALLPMPRGDYAQDFLRPGERSSPALDEFRSLLARAASVTELPRLPTDPLQPPAPRAEQYAELGHALVREIDCLLAVWDGQEAAGPGGTASVVEEAREHGVPVLLIDPAEPDRARLDADPAGPPSRAGTNIGDQFLDALVAGAILRRPGRPA